MTRLQVLAFVTALAISSPASATRVQFTGESTADETLTVDTLRHIALFGSRFSCPSVDAVEAQILPKSFVLPAKYVPVGSSAATYERWNATFCGKVVPLLIAFWPASSGGMLFQVSYPYPDTAAAP
jgi:hypothetical protein